MRFYGGGECSDVCMVWGFQLHDEVFAWYGGVSDTRALHASHISRGAATEISRLVRG